MSPLLTPLFVLSVGLGMRHALEPDHLAAVSTLASEQRSARAGLWLGAMWGIGHSASLFVVGGGLVLLEAQMPLRLSLMFELLVAVMVLGLGVRAIVRSFQEGRSGALRTHAHAGLVHTHSTPGTHVHVRSWVFTRRPLLIGLMHGLAGSSALTALVLAELPSSAQRLAYIVAFGAGSIIGMALLTGLAGLPLMRVARAPRLASLLLLITGIVSAGVGALWGFESGLKLLVS